MIDNIDYENNRMQSDNGIFQYRDGRIFGPGLGEEGKQVFGSDMSDDKGVGSIWAELGTYEDIFMSANEVAMKWIKEAEEGINGAICKADDGCAAHASAILNGLGEFADYQREQESVERIQRHIQHMNDGEYNNE